MIYGTVLVSGKCLGWKQCLLFSGKSLFEDLEPQQWLQCRRYRCMGSSEMSANAFI